MRAVRNVTFSVLPVLALFATSFVLLSPLISAPSAAATISWQTAASYPPLTNVRAVSCAPDPTPTTTTCVAVGDDGGSYASIIVTNNGGMTWTNGTPPRGVTSLAAVSCPSALICYAGGGAGIMKSIDGGSTWTISDSSFPPLSISCVTTSQCTAVGGTEIVGTTTSGSSWEMQTPPANLNSLRSVSCESLSTCVAVGVVSAVPAVVGTTNGSTWTTLALLLYRP